METVVFGPFIGELGWVISRWIGYCRLRRFTDFKPLKSVAIDYDWRYPLYSDFIDEFIPIPQWVVDLGWEQDCYELVPNDAPPGFATPQSAYGRLITECATRYDPATTWTVRPPRGCNFFIQFNCKQMWKPFEPSEFAEKYVASLLEGCHNIVVLSGRARRRAPERNVPESVWNLLVDYLVDNHFTVVIAGTPHSSALVHKVGRNIINLIPHTDVHGLDKLIAVMRRAKFSITSQSGPTHISLHCETPSYIIGHERHRHSVTENYLNTPVMFRTVPHEIYSMVTADQILQDVLTFNNQLDLAEKTIANVYDSCNTSDKDMMNSLIDKPPITLYPLNVEQMRKELTNG